MPNTVSSFAARFQPRYRIYNGTPRRVDGYHRELTMLTDLIPTLQLAIGPVILISGVGLLLLSMTNRFGRIIDRAHLLAHASGEPGRASYAAAEEQLAILARRARIVRSGIALAAISALLAAVLVITLFLGGLLHLPIAAVVVGLFVLCMLSLIASLLCFLSDINLSLKALWLEMPDRR
jgi:hypothetical protein